MKKAENNKDLNIENIVEDMENLLEALGDFNKTKLEDLNLKDLESKVNIFEKKYKDILPEESKDNLDSKK
jgi:hypothetical protein|tara:strand:- start:53 stop:262 length:210 start_codon:yes stop_codon:yes gene_type:complete